MGAVGKSGYTSPVTTTEVEVHYDGFVLAQLAVVSPESAVGVYGADIQYVATRCKGSGDFLFVVTLNKLATCTMHGKVTSNITTPTASPIQSTARNARTI